MPHDDGQPESRPFPLPPDVDAESGYRLPLPRREDMDIEGQAVFDATLASANASYRGKAGPGAGLKGPAGIQLYSPHYRRVFQAMNDYLRFQAGIPPRLREIVILATAGETSHEFEWTAHEPMALREGVEAEIIEIIRSGKPTDTLAAEDSVAIDLVRETVGRRKVTAGTYAKALSLHGPRTLVDISGLIGHYLAVGVLLNIFDMQLRPGTQPLLNRSSG